MEQGRIKCWSTQDLTLAHGEALGLEQEIMKFGVDGTLLLHFSLATPYRYIGLSFSFLTHPFIQPWTACDLILYV